MEPAIELRGGSGASQPVAPGRRSISGLASGLLSRTNNGSRSHMLPLWNSISATSPDSQGFDGRQVEDYTPGYPRFSALISAHDSLHIFRGFSQMRVRLLLLKQDGLVLLEKRLAQIDKNETNLLSLSSSRRDSNSERQSILADIEKSLASYDELLENTRRTLAYERPSTVHSSSLRNWIDGGSGIFKGEVEYLRRHEDLVTLSAPHDGAMSRLEYVATALLSYLHRGDTMSKASRDPNVHLFPRSSTNRVACAIVTPLITMMLMMPVIICNYVVNVSARLAIITLATSLFITSLSLLTNAKTVDVAVAGATYATVLVVFIQN